MSDTHAETAPMTRVAYVAGEPLPDRAPPLATTGVLGWLRANLFSNWFSSVLTVIAVYFLFSAIPPMINWLIIDADFTGTSRDDCSRVGACWAVVSVRWEQLMYGFFPETERWRADLAFVLLFVALYFGLYDKAVFKRQGMWFVCAYPFIAYWLFYGGFFGLEYVESSRWGGLLLTLALGVTGIAFAIPFGILLALGRQSKMAGVRGICVAFIELIRGVPLITILFFANIMLPLFMPEGMSVDNYLRVVVGVCLFASAYMAEVIRGGLQAVPKGQVEAAEALGLSYWKTMRLIVLPQALKISIPGMVNTSIGLYKDTTLVALVGLFDLFGMGRAIVADQKWMGLDIELYVFIALLFFISCFAMSRYSLWLEKKLSVGDRR